MRGDGGEGVCVCMCMYRWVSESVSEWCECGVCEWCECGLCEWGMWEWVSEWVGGWVSEWVSGWSEWVSEGVSEWVRERVMWVSDVSDVSVVCVSQGCESEWVSACVSEWMSEWVSNEWGSEWVREWVRVCVRECTWVRGCGSRSGIDQHHDLRRRSMQKQAMINSQAINGVHPTCTLSHACHTKAAEPQVVPRLPRPRDARAYIRPLGSAHCPTPATQKRRSPKGRQGIHPTPWQRTLSHACHAKEAEPQGTPGRTSNPLAAHIVLRLPRKKGGATRDARAYIRPLGSAHCPTPATQKRRSPKGRQGVHPTPWQCTLSHACHAKAAEPQRMPGRTSDPLAVHIVPRLPHKRSGAPRDARAYIRPLGSAHCPTPATQKRRSPKGRQGVHPTLWQCTLSHACHAKEAEPQGRQGVHRTPWQCTQGVHPTPWQCTLSHACHAKAAEPQGTPGRTSDPLAVHIVPRLPRKRGGAPRTPGRTPDALAVHTGRTSDPLAVHIVPRLPRKRSGAPRDARTYIRPLGSAYCPTPATQKKRTFKGRQGVHPTPWQCTLPHACHAKAAEPQGTPGRTSDPLAVHIVPRLPHKRSGPSRDARAYIRPLGTQKTRSPKGRQGVHPTPWQCTLSHACHAKEAEPQGTPGRTPNPLAVHIVPRLPRKSGGAPRDARAYIQPLGSAHCPTPATEWVNEWVSERESDVSEWCECCECGLCEWGMCEWVSERERVMWVSDVSAVSVVCVSEGCVSEWVSEGGREWVSGGGRSGYRTKHKNPTRQCGEKCSKPLTSYVWCVI